jgi:hypothetical protein
VCGGADGCEARWPAAACACLDNGQGQEHRGKDGWTYWVYDLRTFRHSPSAEEAIRLFCAYFLNRTDFVCFFAPWGKPCPAVGAANLDALLRAHVAGDRMRPTPTLEWRSRENSGKKRGRWRIGSYAPGADGLTRWLVLDFDGGGEHSAPLADPLAVALSALGLCHRAGIPAYLERSGGGKGWHLWVFFAAPIAARKARALGHAVAPRDAVLTNGAVADPRAAAGIEIFPKADTVREGGVGNAVWLPWFWKAKPGCGAFYRRAANGLRPFIPDGFDTVDEAAVDRALACLKSPSRLGGAP